MSSTALLRLARFAKEVQFADIPGPVVTAARRLIFDHLGTVHAGQQIPEATRIVAIVRDRRGLGNSTVLAAGFRTHVADAAFANGTAADVLEYQDGYRFGGFHPSHSLPALLAMAERQDALFSDFVVATVVAYEVANRIGSAQHPGATKAGWFPTAAAFGAAAGCSRLLGLSAESCADALGATAFSVPAITIESIFAGPTSKPSFAGYIARAGVEGALLAEAGLSGWHGALEAPRGLVDLTGGDPKSLVEGAKTLGQKWTMLDVHQKRFAACRHTHGAAQAAIAIVSQHGLQPRDVQEIDVETYSVAKLLVDRGVPTDAGATSCTLSLPYVVAAAIADRTVTGAQYDPARISDPEIRRLTGLVNTRVVQDLEDRYPEFTATRVTIGTTQGASYTAEVDLPAGDSRAPLTREQLVDKFLEAFPLSVPRATLNNVVSTVLDAEPTFPVRRLISMLTEATCSEE